ncbi:PREDICTED: hemocyte protein-glutamine gamma-glutamyltransferase-like isoform X2 [Priapulus caudatus]|uniref:Hemocyte protein-glutamine gamma-glutamyltransferase-like isoform X2 n=1 Tax=Priapulus caudatus TaxID=37621 RepID=A0ABM1E639_PRICU|nr:PREDICTED: hemocyte protein-glutamine gamma-glutamyltransferase-like isoform X2 [Priapulus caudatus]
MFSRSRYQVRGSSSTSGRVQPGRASQGTTLASTTAFTAFNVNKYGGLGSIIPGMSSWSRDPSETFMSLGSPDSGVGSPTHGRVGSGQDQSAILEVGKIDWEAAINATDHHTDRFDAVESGKPVIRRGQVFKLTVHFKRQLIPHRDTIRFKFEFGRNPFISRGTRVLRTVQGKELDNNDWGVRLRTMSGTHTIMDVMTPADCPVGIWKMSIITNFKDDVKKMQTFKCDQGIYVLFNPWVKEDLTYMDDKKEIEEYVLNDMGKIWCGTSKRLRYRAWNFGQYEDPVLDAAIRVLDASKLDAGARGNPVKIVRTISAMVNAPDDNGVLEGNWSGSYEGGTPPTQWQGSVQILTKWFESGEPVCFGQCWVFSGVTTTVLRALGIPGRSVTNFASAHDTNCNITVDFHYSQDYSKLEDMNMDSIWNFHVWNESWMARPDLPAGNGGWQAIDATPQETSEGVFCAGPAAVSAIRKGEVGILYDAPFIFAEVNADIIHWLCPDLETEDMVKLKMDTNGVGQSISTKRPGPMGIGNSDRLDVTDSYKATDRSDEERAAVINALMRGHSSSTTAYDVLKEDVIFTLDDKDDVLIGQPFSIFLKMKNTSKEKRTVEITMHLETTYYTGVVAEKVKTEKFTVVLEPLKDNKSSITGVPDEYLDLLVDQAAFQVSAIGTVKETKQVICLSDDFRVRAPDVIVKSDGKCQVGKPCKVDVKFVNPLTKILHKCMFILEAPGLEKPHEIACSNVEAKGTASMSYTCQPKHAGMKTILVSFTSKELSDADGFLTVDVKPAATSAHR